MWAEGGEARGQEDARALWGEGGGCRCEGPPRGQGRSDEHGALPMACVHFQHPRMSPLLRTCRCSVWGRRARCCGGGLRWVLAMLTPEYHSLQGWGCCVLWLLWRHLMNCISCHSFKLEFGYRDRRGERLVNNALYASPLPRCALQAAAQGPG